MLVEHNHNIHAAEALNHLVEGDYTSDPNAVLLTGSGPAHEWRPLRVEASCYRRVLLSSEMTMAFGRPPLDPPAPSPSSNGFWTRVAFRILLSGANGATLLLISSLKCAATMAFLLCVCVSLVVVVVTLVVLGVTAPITGGFQPTHPHPEACSSTH